MTRALIWKEWRVQSPLMVAAVIAAFVQPLFVMMGSLGGFRGDSLTQVLPALTVAVLLPVFAAATGALCFAEDRSGDTLGFLLSRPISRRRIWLTKVAVALVVLAAITLLTFAASRLLGAFIDGPTFDELVPRAYPAGMRPLGGGGTRTFVIRAISDAFGQSPAAAFIGFTLTGPGFLLLLFGASAFWSTRSKRPLHAMLAGSLTALAFIAIPLTIALTTAEGNTMRLYPSWPIMSAAVLLSVSYINFRQTEPATR
jgi:ABC-type transport system involved in multi-copper enzyme maturation permease subunit